MACSLRRAFSGPVLRACGAQAPYASGSRQISTIAVVGSGPSGFYFVDRLRRLLGGSVNVDIFERLPAPYGLVRYGVAPDHPDTKNVINKFNSIAAEAGVRFFGNVNVGHDIPVEELRSRYNAVVLACGAEDDRHMGIAGEDCKGSLSARQFVNWYNGHPEFTNVPVDLPRVRSVGIIGLGNVALDCARILLRPFEELSGTDIADHALQQLQASGVDEVHIIGRRGPLQSQFSGKELREVLSLANAAIEVHPAAYEPTKEDAKEPRKAQKVLCSWPWAERLSVCLWHDMNRKSRHQAGVGIVCLCAGLSGTAESPWQSQHCGPTPQTPFPLPVQPSRRYRICRR